MRQERWERWTDSGRHEQSVSRFVQQIRLQLTPQSCLQRDNVTIHQKRLTVTETLGNYMYCDV